MKNYPPNKVNRIIELGPIVLVTTFNREKPNIMTMGFHMMIQHEPPLIDGELAGIGRLMINT